MNRIQKLEAEIQKLKKQEADKKKAKYQYLVGKCIHMAHTSYEKITAIVRVNTDEIGDEVVYDCIHIYFDNREDVSNSDSSIQLASYASEYVKRIEKNIISQEVFDKAMDECFAHIKRIIGKISTYPFSVLDALTSESDCSHYVTFYFVIR